MVCHSFFAGNAVCGKGCHGSPAVLGTDMQNMYGTCTCKYLYLHTCSCVLNRESCVLFLLQLCVCVCVHACMYCVFGSKTFFFIQSVTVVL